MVPSPPVVTMNSAPHLLQKYLLPVSLANSKSPLSQFLSLRGNYSPRFPFGQHRFSAVSAVRRRQALEAVFPQDTLRHLWYDYCSYDHYS